MQMPTLSADEWQRFGYLSRWLIMVRGAVLSMTVSAGIIAVLLALAMGPVSPLRVILLIVGLTAAHATNNLINDWVDWRQGVDSDNYFRTRYGTHALMQSLISETSFLATTVLTGLAAALCGLTLSAMVGSDILWLMLVGGVFVLFYTWPMKHFGLGEIAVLIVWGPLMIGGGVYVLTESLSPDVLAISLVYGVAPTLVIFGKHIDKSAQDRDLDIRTLPVLLGERASRAVCLLMLGIIAGGMAVVTLTLDGGYWLALTLVSVPAGTRLANALMSARPETRPADYPEAIWPLWFAALCFGFARNFGAALVLALMIRALT